MNAMHLEDQMREAMIALDGRNGKLPSSPRALVSKSEIEMDEIHAALTEEMTTHDLRMKVNNGRAKAMSPQIVRDRLNQLLTKGRVVRREIVGEKNTWRRAAQ